MTKQHGFSLIEVLVAMVIMMIVGAGMVSMISMINRELTFSTSKMGNVTLVHDLSVVVNNPDLCKAALAIQTLPAGSTDPEAIAPVQFQLDQTLIDGSKSTDLPTYKVTVRNLFFNQITSVGTLRGLPLYAANLAFDSSEMSNGQSGAAADTKRQIKRSQVAKIFLQLASKTDRTITACYSSGNNDNLLQLVCESMHGTFNATTSTCSGTNKPCDLGGNPYGPSIFDTIDSKKRNDQSLGAVLGLGTNVKMIGGSQQWTADLSDADKSLIASIRSTGQIPSGMQIGSGTQAVCIDGKWVDSGVTQSAPPAGEPNQNNGGKAASGGSHP